MGKKVLGIGHCGFDSGRLESLVQKMGTEFNNAGTITTALDMLKSNEYAVALPNRIISGDENGGFNAIREILKLPIDTKVLLISGIEEAQQKAKSLGAEPGFGKDQIEEGGAELLLRNYI